MTRTRELRIRFLAAVAASLPACSAPQTTTPQPDDTATATTPNVDTSPPDTAIASTTDAASSAASSVSGGASTLPTPASTPDVTRTDLGQNFWNLSGAPVEAAHNPGKPRPPTSGPPTKADYDRMPTCPSGFVCGREPAKVSGTPAPTPFGACDSTITPPAHHGDSIRFSSGATTFERKVEPKACCYSWFTPCPGGRPLRDGASDAIVADVVVREGWCDVDVLGVVDREAASRDVRATVAAHWAREASFEHASVASFAVASLELLSLGAPAALIDGAHRAALDEIDHARRCFALAAAHGGAAQGPGPLPVHSGLVAVGAAAIAEKTLRDGCLNETIATLIATRTGESAREAQVVETLSVIATDEARHAELGFRTLGWLVATFPDAVVPVLEAEVRVLRDETTERRAPAASSGGSRDLRAYGVPSVETTSEARREAIAGVVLPCLEAILASAPSRAVEGERCDGHPLASPVGNRSA